MPTSPTARPTHPPTLWAARGRHVGSAAEDTVLRRLRRLKDDHVIDDFLEPPDEPAAAATPGPRIFEARWKAPGAVTVRARLILEPGSAGGQEWTLLAEAEEAWDLAWPSPATVFWPDDPDVTWDRDAATGLRLRGINTLPDDDKAVRRLLKEAGRSPWNIHVVVHEAMTPDHRGRVPLAQRLPPGLRHRVVEHRAAPQQLRVVNWALEDFGVQVPRGGAVVLPGTPAPADFAADDFSVRTVFLDGSEPTGLIAAVTSFAALPRPLPDDAVAALGSLREDWRLLTLEEELERERKLVAMYAEALEAMTQSRDLYREAAERAAEALAVYRESAAAATAGPAPSQTPPASPLRSLTRTLERFRGSARTPRPDAPARDTPEPPGTPGADA
ncbi:PE-PGRS family protein OS=Streptomyces tendae OX=1932 GN=GUR47_05000 PE=4 SV=1 [Streptomyces tendae]